ncbi:NAD-glutamate dehydrogenase [Magnetospirillum aberrantis]|uniref:NAD-glutamate dehydrogenase n=1 Tax=Magnetospirillum aberrantis SpK TaxID=908842 RepID=A0A7C9URD8_9PROT|nr:NAD-glutamate dehydrogenase [Magnetospirillum aberrantis]NFV78527.1 NAD-glutamate dehydrogenase [Magnetospirillum aberrantis SpK]
MIRPADFLKSTLTEDMSTRAATRLDPVRARLVSHLAPLYLAGVPAADLEAVDGEQMFAVMVGLLDFAAERPMNEPKIRVFNPDPDRDGWASPHSVVEIVNDDMPFLVDSVAMVLAGAGIAIHQLVHPIVRATRDDKNALTALEGAPTGGGASLESLMHVEIDRQDAEGKAALLEQLTHTLGQARAAVVDWQAMRERIRAVTADLDRDNDEDEATAFLDWLYDDHFTFLGYRHFLLSGHGDAPDIRVEPAHSLGILRDETSHVFDDTLALSDMPPEIRAFLTRPGALMVTKSARHAPVHRPVHMDIIGIKHLDKKGRVIGLHAFLGLFTAAAYTRAPSAIPLLRRKVSRVQSNAGFPPFGHDAKVLGNILETYPRDELFQISEAQLTANALGILHLQDRPRVALFVRRDEFGRFVSCLVFLPRDRYDTPLRLAVIRLLEQAYGGRLDAYYTQVADGPLARLHVIVRIPAGSRPMADEAELQSRIAELARSWSDHLQAALVQAHGEGEGLRLARRWRDAFPLSYREAHSALAAVADVERLEAVTSGADLGVNLYRPIEAGPGQARLKLLHAGSTVPLSDVLPLLEAMGLRVIAEVPHEVRPADGGESAWIHDFQLESEAPLDLAARGADFEQALLAVWRGEAESDGFNRLVLAAGLNWRQVMVLRAYAKYLRQAGSTLSQAYVERALAGNAEPAALLVKLFETRFIPGGDEDKARSALETALEKVSSADDDRILRRFLNLIGATLRTNYTLGRPYLSFKLDSRAIDDLPLPRPMVEIFVYSPRMEGIHLRGGKVARGGIRWSDRREDFRTEILGLMKAQMVKNAVIVPVGAKGGFVVKRPPAGGDRAALQAEGIECYRTLIRGMLDLTDNLAGGAVVAPAGLIRHDGDDPYLVVAADKGTATFSDIANGLSLEYGFWLGDAFASGGSKGYDHKVMGITARGAWEAVKRHFRELGIDTQAESFTVVGVGDMSGDVFGNAMLCSPHIRLVAAFNHSHIFVDPEPDAASSFVERQRLFQAAKAWPDYDPKAISAGGGVFSRAAKSIPVSPEMRARFGIQAATVTPTQLIRILLTQPVDLLFFGGIGTYIKSSEESQAEAGDRTNDALRVDGRDLRARVVGEGANLGCTQLGRIEYALKGGRLNTDAIDNSAGVDTSDHEVNIKILLGDLVAAGDMTGKQRDLLLASMTDEVAALVLRDNYLQTQALSIMAEQGAELLDGQVRFMRLLEKSGRLDRAIEFLPDDDTLAERAARHQGLVRPELSVLLAYAKLWLHDSVLASELPDDPFLAGDLVRTFPSALRERFATEIGGHRLRREIIATAVTNSMVNRVGVAFVAECAEKTGHGPADVARAYIVARDAYGLRDIWARVEALDGTVPASVQHAMLAESGRLLERATGWVLRSVPTPFDIGAAIGELQPGIAALRAALSAILPSETAEGVAARSADYQAQGVPADLAWDVANLIVLASAADIVRIAARQGMAVEEAGSLYFAIGHRFGLGSLRASAETLAVGGHWQKLAAAAVIEDLYGSQRDLTLQVAAKAPGQKAAEALDVWGAEHRVAIDRTETVLAELRAARQVDLAMLTVAGRQLKAMVEK